MEIYKKIFALRNEIGKISKDMDNPFHKSKYFDINKLLEHVMPLAEKHGLLIIQPISDCRVTTVIQDIESNTSLKSSIPLPDENNPQKLGSAITYYRRYTLQSLLALEAEDDDGNKASVQDNKVWMNKSQFDKLMKEASAERIDEVLNTKQTPSGAPFYMKKSYREQLEQRRNELES